jgi:phosphoserine phosphatase/putative flippase GtrA
MSGGGGGNMDVYDFDHTIYRGDSSFDFFIFILRKKPYLAALLPVQLWGIMLYLFHLITKETMKSYFFMFVRFISVEAMTIRFWEKHIGKIKLWYLRQKQNTDVIISASPKFLLAPVVRDYLHCTLIASEIDPKTGAYNGKNCWGDEKARRFKDIYPNAKIDRFYSDSYSDAPLAGIAHQSFMVKGDDIVPWQAAKESVIAKIKNTYLSKDFIIFVFCGGTGTLVNFVFSLLISVMVNPSIAYIGGYAISIFITYSLNALLIFHTKLNFAGFIKFIISYIPNFFILYTFVLIFLNILGWNKILVYGLAGLLGLPVTFILVKLITFNKNSYAKNQKLTAKIKRSNALCQEKKMNSTLLPENSTAWSMKVSEFSGNLKQRLYAIKVNILNVLLPPPPPHK